MRKNKLINSIRIGNRRIGEREPVFIIAEIGSNHNRDLRLAKKIIKEISKTGADAVKFQTFKADFLVNRKERPEAYRILKANELPRQWHKTLKNYAEENGLIFMSTPFDFEAVDLLKSLNVDVYKIASGDITNIPLIKYVAKTGKPIIVSVGASNLKLISDTVNAIRKEGNEQIVLCQCVLSYPADFVDANVKVLDYLRDKFGVLTGYSDHSREHLVPLLAVARGAVVIEKHVTLNRKMRGPDHGFALEIGKFKHLVEDIRKTENILGVSFKKISPSEQKAIYRARRSIYTNKFLKKGNKILTDDLVLLRPARGIEPKMISEVVGRKLRRNKKPFSPIFRQDYI